MAVSPRNLNATVPIPALGMRNTRAKGRYPIGALDVAQNADILPDDGKHKTGYEIREGFAQSRLFTNITAAYTTSDGQRMFVIDDGNLREVFADLSSVILAADMGYGYYSFEEVGPQILVLGSNSQLIRGREAYPFFIPQTQISSVDVIGGDLPGGEYTLAVCLVDSFGRRGPLSVVTTVMLPDDAGISATVPAISGYQTLLFVTTTDGEVLYELEQSASTNFVFTGGLSRLVTPVSEEQVASSVISGFDKTNYYNGQLWVCVYEPNQDITYLFYSYSFWLNLFNPQSMYIAIQGKVNTFNSVGGSLIISTDRQILAYQDNALQTLADYGTVPGSASSMDYGSDTLYLWTTRGVCKALPFENLTEEKVSLPPGSMASTAFLNVKGTKRFLIMTDTLGNSFNKY
jgi:hypothetical protein